MAVLHATPGLARLFPLDPGLPGGDAVRLLVLSDWAATQHFVDTLEVRFAIAGVVALLLTGAAFDLVNLIAAMVYVVALPFVAIVLTYLYFDLRVRYEAEGSEPVAGAADLPQELTGPIAPGELPAAGH